jgi:hypothetical protein
MRKILIACLNLVLGIGLGLGLLELTLRANPALLLRGMGLPSPVDPPIETLQYEVRYSDADIFYWQRDQVRPISPENDGLESQVTFETDEFGFPNSAPLPESVDVVVLGRSYSIGAQASQPWPRILARKTGLKVLNLSQTGSGLVLKMKYLNDFGYPRHPRWVILEILPSMDIIGYTPDPTMIVPALPVPIIRQILHQNFEDHPEVDQDQAFYPLPVDIAGQTVDLTFYAYYLAALTVDKNSLQSSKQWNSFQEGLAKFVSQAKERSVCVLLLYAPTKPDIYFPLATQPQQLEPTLQGWSPWRLTKDGDLIQDAQGRAEKASMQHNASAARDLIAEFSDLHDLPFVDPTSAMVQAVKSGESPFMVYDTHWSAIGNQLVAGLVAERLISSSCP